MYVYLYENKLNHYKFCQRIKDVIATTELWRSLVTGSGLKVYEEKQGMLHRNSWPL